MSELLSSVKSSFYHNVRRLEGKEGSYLFRESDIKPGLFIISYVKNSSVSHLVTPNKNGKFIRQTLEEGRQLISQQMSLPALTVSVFQFPLPAPALVMQNQVRLQDLPTKVMKPGVIVAVLQPRIRGRWKVIMRVTPTPLLSPSWTGHQIRVS